MHLKYEGKKKCEWAVRCEEEVTKIAVYGKNTSIAFCEKHAQLVASKHVIERVPLVSYTPDLNVEIN